MTKKIEITLPQNVPWVQIFVAIVLDIVLAVSDFKQQSFRTVLLGLIAPSILIVSTYVQELMDESRSQKIRKWLLVSPLYVFSITCIFLLLPLNSLNITRTTGSWFNWTDNVHGLGVILAYAVFTVVGIAAVLLFMFMCVVPIMFKELIDEKAPYLMFLACVGVSIAWAFVVFSRGPSY